MGLGASTYKSKFPQLVKLMSRWSRWLLREIEEFETEFLKSKEDQYSPYAKALAKVRLDYADDGWEPDE